MLPRNYRFVTENLLGQTIGAGDVTVTARRKKLDSNGAVSFEPAEGTAYNNAGTITTGSLDAGSAIDNSTDKFMEGDFLFEVVAPASSNGDVNLYLQVSTDGGTVFDDNAINLPVATLSFTASGTKRRAFFLS